MTYFHGMVRGLGCRSAGGAIAAAMAAGRWREPARPTLATAITYYLWGKSWGVDLTGIGRLSGQAGLTTPQAEEP